MDPLSKVKPTGIPDFVPGSLIGETARFFGMSVAPVVPQKPVALPALHAPKNTRYISPPATTLIPKNTTTPTRVIVKNHPIPVVRRTLKLPNNHGNLNYYLNNVALAKNHKSKVNTRRRR